MRSMVSIQILSGVICFCCVSYFIIILYFPYSIGNFIGHMNLGLQQERIEAQRLIPDRSTALTGKANSSTESYICDAVKSSPTHNRTSPLSFEIHRFNHLHRSYSHLYEFPMIELSVLLCSLLRYCSHTSKSMDIS